MSDLIKINPSSNFRSLSQQMRRTFPNLFSDFFDDFSMPRIHSFPLMGENPEPQIRINVSDRPKEYYIRADIPGAKKEDIHVSVEGNYVTIRAQTASETEEKDSNEQIIRWECSTGNIMRSFQLPTEVNKDQAKANYKDGILFINLPKVNGGTISEITIQ
jgi:HSP20 family protein